MIAAMRSEAGQRVRAARANGRRHVGRRARSTMQQLRGQNGKQTRRQARNERENQNTQRREHSIGKRNTTIHSSDLSHLYSFGTIRSSAALLHISSFSFLLSYAGEREPRLRPQDPGTELPPPKNETCRSIGHDPQQHSPRREERAIKRPERQTIVATGARFQGCPKVKFK